MKTSKLLLASLIIATILGSCSKVPNGNLGNLITPTGTSTFAIANNGGNVTCGEVATATSCDFEFTSGRIDYYGGTGGIIDGIITWTTDGTYVTWSSSVPISVAVIVKGGPCANVYFSGCDDCKETSGTVPLSAPINPNNGKPYGLSNITFCYNLCEDEEELIVAIKAFYYPAIGDRTYCISSGTCPFGPAEWCGVLGYQDYIPGSSFNMLIPATNTQIGVAEIESDGDVKVTLNNGLILDVTHVYVGTLDDLVGSGACPNYESWPSETVDGNSQTVEF